MRLLALDTATPATVVGLLLPGAAPREARDDPPPGARPRHMTALLPLARGLLADAGLAFADLDRVAVGLGPGSFTGLRVGVATARALAGATGAELVGVPTLRALAHAAEREHPAAEVVAVVDARRGEVFAASWHAGAPLLPPRALAPAALAAELEGRTLRDRLAVGDGAVRFASLLQPAGVTVPSPGSALHRVSAAALCHLGADGEPAPRDAVVPEYLRRPDAELALRARGEG